MNKQRTTKVLCMIAVWSVYTMHQTLVYSLLNRYQITILCYTVICTVEQAYFRMTLDVQFQSQQNSCRMIKFQGCFCGFLFSPLSSLWAAKEQGKNIIKYHTTALETIDLLAFRDSQHTVTTRLFLTGAHLASTHARYILHTCCAIKSFSVQHKRVALKKLSLS